jgi:hypothetical protein
LFDPQLLRCVDPENDAKWQTVSLTCDNRKLLHFEHMLRDETKLRGGGMREAHKSQGYFPSASSA